MIGSGLFVRFGEVFEGFLPARACPGDYFELDDARDGAAGPPRRRAYRLGDPKSSSRSPRSADTRARSSFGPDE